MPRKIRSIRIEGNIAHITLTKGYIAIIDATDVPLVDGGNWRAQEKRRSDGLLRAVYAMRSVRIDGRRTAVLLHRVILSAIDGMEVDHIDGNGLDNRRVNLRLATKAENQHNSRTRCTNTSGVKGVSWRRQCGKWYAQIQVNGQNKHIGLFNDIDAAAAAYAAASAEFHGKFGRIT